MCNSSPAGETAAYGARALCLAVLLLLPTNASPGAEPPVRHPSTVVMAGDRAYPPFQFLDAEGQPDGFDVELFRAVAERAMLTPEVRLGDWKYSVDALQSGQVQVVPMFVTPERSRRFLFSRPFLQRHHLVFARQGSRYIASLDELRGARVAVQNAGLAADALDAVGGAELLRTATEAEAITAVASGVAGFALVPTTIGYLAVLESGTDEVVAVSQPLLSLPYAFAVASDRPDLVRVLDAALAGVQADGTSDRLWLAWLANLQPTRRDGQRWLAPAVATIGLVSCLALWWRRRSARASPAAQAGDLQLVHELRAALAADAVGVAVQPKLDLATGTVSGAELLVRWTHPRLGPLPPAAFIPQAERHGALGELSLYMVRRAVQYYREWHAQGLDLVLSVNVSIADLADAAIVDAIMAAVRGLPQMLLLEVTEDTAMHSPELVMASVLRLRASGVGISLDDFGIGHSTLSRLRRLAPDELKIDRSFVTGVLQSPSDQLIVRSSIALAHDLGARFIAEGVEDQDTLDWLAAAGADEVQGYAVARPMPPEALCAFCRDRAGPRTGASQPRQQANGT